MTLTQALIKLQAAGKIQRIYHPGMLYFTSSGLPERLDDSCPDVAELATWTPVVDDHATRGCLLALLREAAANPSIFISRAGRGYGWVAVRVVDGGHSEATDEWFGPVCATESAALVAALVQLAEAL